MINRNNKSMDKKLIIESMIISDKYHLLKENENYNAVGIAEGFVEAESEDQVIEAWQHLVNTGLAWTLQGFFGRMANQLIESGVINQPKGEDNE